MVEEGGMRSPLRASLGAERGPSMLVIFSFMVPPSFLGLVVVIWEVGMAGGHGGWVWPLGLASMRGG